MTSYDYLTVILKLNNKDQISICNSIICKIWENSSVLSVTFVTSGRINSIYRINLQNAPVRSVILRVRYMNDDCFKQGFACESWVKNKFNNSEFYAVPILYRYDDKRKDANFDYGIYEDVQGTTLTIVHEKKWFELAGEILGKIHEVPVNKYGKKNEEIACEASEFYRKYFKSVLDSLKKYDYFIFKMVSDIVEKYFGDEFYSGLSPVLLHHDYHMKNILIDNANKMFIIDWDSARGGIPEVDFIKMKYLTLNKCGMDNVFAFLEGYKKVKQLPMSMNFPVQELIWLCKMFMFENDWSCSDDPYFPDAPYYKESIIRITNNFQKRYCYLKNEYKNRNNDVALNIFWGK
jgi:hypothetical protein